MTRKEISALRKDYPYLTADRIKFIIEHTSKKTMRGIRNELKRANDEFVKMENEPPTKRIEIDIQWTKNRTWGYCPTATAWVLRRDGSWGKAIAHAGGCGYDKQSTVVADCLNQLCRGMLWRKRKTRKKVPYGVHLLKDYQPSFEGGVGMSCYYAIAIFLGGKMTHVTDAPMFDRFIFEF